MKKRFPIFLISAIAAAAALILLLCPLPKQINAQLSGFGTAVNGQVGVRLDGTIYRYLVKPARYKGKIEISTVPAIADYQFDLTLTHWDFFFASAWYYNKNTNKNTNKLTSLGTLYWDNDFNLFYIDLETGHPYPAYGDIVIGAESAEEAAEILSAQNITPRDSSLSSK